jgi:hypothetical protein
VSELQITMSESMLLCELQKFARTCLLETARHLKEQNGNEEHLPVIADQFAKAYLAYLIKINMDEPEQKSPDAVRIGESDEY